MAHNKKRNTAFLYEVLLREGTKAAINKDIARVQSIKNIILEHFRSNSLLKAELELYKSLEEKTVEPELAERFVREVVSRYEKLDKTRLFNEQTSLINKINKMLGMETYNCFVPNYKDLASAAQVFNSHTPIKQKLLLEQEIINKVKIVEDKEKRLLQPIDNFVYKTFSNKFNEKYSSLLREQKELLSKYVNSFNGNRLELKVFLNEEIQRLNEQIELILKKDEIVSQPSLAEKTSKTLDYLKTFKEVKEISQGMLEKVMKIQQFVHEVNK